jgi:hypothetical protein
MLDVPHTGIRMLSRSNHVQRKTGKNPARYPSTYKMKIAPNRPDLRMLHCVEVRDYGSLMPRCLATENAKAKKLPIRSKSVQSADLARPVHITPGFQRRSCGHNHLSLAGYTMLKNQRGYSVTAEPRAGFALFGG